MPPSSGNDRTKQDVNVAERCSREDADSEPPVCHGARTAGGRGPAATGGAHVSTIDIPVAGDLEVQADIGDSLVLRLPETATTGYQWATAEVADHLKVVSSRLETSGTMAPGAAAQRVIQLVALRSGAGSITLRLARSWESAAAREHRVSVQVRPTDQPQPGN